VIRSRRFSLSINAINDLINIYDYIAEKNPVAARRMLSALEAKIKSLAKSGNSGVSRDWIRPGLRAFPYRDRCIYFRVDETTLHVLRIVHGHQAINPDDFKVDNDR
jgi:plasmid stabilization system protein ParE